MLNLHFLTSCNNKINQSYAIYYREEPRNSVTTQSHKVDESYLVDRFMDLARINSPSGQESEVCAELIACFEALDKDNQIISSRTDEYGNLFIRIPGMSPYTLAITGHMDVVPPCHDIHPIVVGEGDEQIIKSDGRTVLGADDKTALAAMLASTKTLLEEKGAHPNLLFIITTKEEVNLQGARAIEPDYYSDAYFVIAFDTTGPQGTIVNKQPAYYKYKLSVIGRSAHAGVSPEQGINAIQILSKLILTLPQGRLDIDTTTNIGCVEGGRAINVVADYASVRGEFRSHIPERVHQEIEKIHQAVRNIQPQYPEAKIRFEVEDCFGAYETPLDHPALLQVEKTMRDMNLEINYVKSNGASDVNIFANRGLPGIVLSAGYIAPHTLEERVYVKDMLTMTQVLLNLYEAFSTWQK